MSEKRARLKKGTVIDERQDENRQWWTTVVRDTATGFKSVTRKIEAPNCEVPQSASPSDARR
jgi:hypothetical protein